MKLRADTTPAYPKTIVIKSILHNIVPFKKVNSTRRVLLIFLNIMWQTL